MKINDVKRENSTKIIHLTEMYLSTGSEGKMILITKEKEKVKKDVIKATKRRLVIGLVSSIKTSDTRYDPLSFSRKVGPFFLGSFPFFLIVVPSNGISAPFKKAGAKIHESRSFQLRRTPDESIIL